MAERFSNICFQGIRGVLLDIEGTTSSVSFVYDEMFPLVRQRLAGFLAEHWRQEQVQNACQQIARDGGHESLAAWCPGDEAEQQACIRSEVIRLMDADAKATGLKALQGVMWRSAFESGELVAHLFDDVHPALRDWHAAGVALRIYSSGSIGAQQLFFGHTVAGDLLPLVSGHYDTTTGPKREAASYQAIAADWGLKPEEILFASDVPAELNAARAAGMQTVLLMRPGNAPVEDDTPHPQASSFGELQLDQE